MWRRWSWQWWIYWLGFATMIVGVIGGIVVLFTSGVPYSGWLLVTSIGIIANSSMSPSVWKVLRERRSKNGPPGQS